MQIEGREAAVHNPAVDLAAKCKVVATPRVVCAQSVEDERARKVGGGLHDDVVPHALSLHLVDKHLERVVHFTGLRDHAVDDVVAFANIVVATEVGDGVAVVVVGVAAASVAGAAVDAASDDYVAIVHGVVADVATR